MIYLPRYPQIIAGLSHVSQQFLVLLLHEAHLSDGECEEEVSAESVGVEGEAVVDEGGAEPEVVADQGLLPEVWPEKELEEREGRFLSRWSPWRRNETEGAR